MAHNHPLSTPFTTNPIDGDGLDDALVARVALTFDDVADIQALDLTGKATSHIVFGTSVYEYDASDTVSAHNGTTILVTADGKRFKNTGTRVNGRATYDVDDRDLTSPPGSPTEGDSYLLPASPSGAWASNGKHIAVYINGDWVYIAPQRGMILYVDDEAAFIHYDGSVWQDGLGALQITDGSIKASRLEQAYGWRVEAEQAAPPGSIPAAGVLYIVATSGSGAWSGEDGNIARSTGSAWEFVTAAEGMTVFDKDRGFNVSYKSGSWQADRATGLLLHRGSRVTPSDTGSVFASWVTFVTLGSYTVGAANNRVFVRAGLVVGASTSTEQVDIGLFMDSETSPRATVSMGLVAESLNSVSVELEYAFPDLTSRAVYLKLKAPSGLVTGSALGYAYLEEVSG